MKLHVSWRKLPKELWFVAWKDTPVRMYQSEESLLANQPMHAKGLTLDLGSGWEPNPNYRILKATITYEDVTSAVGSPSKDRSSSPPSTPAE